MYTCPQSSSLRPEQQPIARLYLRNARVYCFALCCCLLWFSSTVSRGVILFYHLDYPGQPWYLANGFLTDRVDYTIHVVTTTSLPPGRYMFTDSEKRELWNFERQNVPAPPGTEVFTLHPGSQQAQNFQVGAEYPFGTHDLHAVYLLEYYTRTVVGSAAGGGEVTGAAMVGGGRVDHVLDLNYTVAYGDLPLDRDSTGGSGDTCPGMAQYSLGKSLAALIITDTPLGYRPPRGPAMDFTLSYNSSSSQPASGGFPHFGTHWTFNWFSYVVDDPNNNTSTRVYLRGGGIEQCTGFNSSSQSFAPDPYTRSVLVKTSLGYERRHPDGSKEIYARSDQASSYPHKTYLTKLTDATGNEADNAATISYDQGLTGHLRPKIITDALGKHTTIYYDVDDGTDKIISLGNDFGKTVTFGYTDGRLHTITDPVGIVSEFEYEEDGFIKKLVTPYGPTTFTHGGGFSPFVEAIDPLGGRERVEYRNAAPGISPTDPSDTVPSGFNNAALDVRNSFYWDKKATQMFPPVNGVYDYTKARIQHWLLSVDGSFVSRVPSSTKAPLENRVWYLYPGQSDSSHMGSLDKPSTVARMLNPTTPQISSFQYNNLGNTTKTTDPAGRVTSYVYDTNNLDVLTIYQRNPSGASVDPDGAPADKVANYTYNSLHERLTETDTAGQEAIYTYNTSGQILTRKNAKDEITTYAYGDGSTVPTGYLASITSPPVNGVSAITSFLYDFANRVRDVTNEADQYTVTTDYDLLDRKTVVTYPDGTSEEFQYTQYFGQELRKILDLTASKDRLNRWTYRHYNGNRQMDSITDPLPRTTHYGWCNCGSLASITDPNMNVTTFVRDLQSRLISKIFADGSGISTTVNYAYEDTTSRLKSMTDALNQTTNYQYRKDDNLEQVSYTNALKPTPTVNFDYDLYYNRVKSMTTQGIGTTNYTYYPVGLTPILGANRLHTTYGLYPNDTIEYTYDELGRTRIQSVNGVKNTVERDPLGRLMNTDNDVLGHFGRDYYGVTPRLHTLTYPNQQSANYTYFGNDEDRRLQTLENFTESGAVNLSTFDYTYDNEGQIGSWIRLLGEKSSGRWFDYDNARQLKSAHNAENLNDSAYALDFGYDLAGNRTSDHAYSPSTHNYAGVEHEYTPNALNQIGLVLTTQNDGPTTPAWLTWDANGNITYDGAHLTFEWDAANRLSGINHTDSGQRTEFAYDGLGRRVKITEYGPGVTATIQPKGSDWTKFETAPFTLPSGSYALTFEGLISNGEDLTLIDSVTLNNTLVDNGDFESPDVSQSPGGYEYGPSQAIWEFIKDTGIASNGSDLTSRNPGSPDGNQVGFIQGAGRIFQTRTVSAGTYTLSFQAAQGGNNTGQQQVRVTLRPSGAASQVKTFVWCGTQICEERDGSGATVTKRFFAEGEQRIGGRDAGNYYYSRDHLGSIREVTNAAGALQARYDYDAYGNSVVVDGKMNVDFGYTGHYFHAPSGLNLTLYRVYNPALGRWLSRDPIGEAGGLNLYRYVSNDPLQYVDPTGLDPVPAPVGPDGAPLPPPIPLPPGKDGQPNRWVPIPGSDDRPTKWKPERPCPSDKGGQPSASWDPSGHWDGDDGTGGPRKHYNVNGLSYPAQPESSQDPWMPYIPPIRPLSPSLYLPVGVIVIMIVLIPVGI